MIFAVTDKRNGPPPAGMLPLVVFILILGLGAGWGMQTAYAINPARDLGPRIMTAMVGYGRAGTSHIVRAVDYEAHTQVQSSITARSTGSGHLSAALLPAASSARSFTTSLSSLAARAGSIARAFSPSPTSSKYIDNVS